VRQVLQPASLFLSPEDLSSVFLRANSCAFVDETS
jgi:hypothetical protein